MANQFPEQTYDQSKTVNRAVLAARFNTLQLLSAAVVALLLLVGTVHANIFVSRFDNSQVDLYDDAGNLIKAGFISGGQGSEGFACVKLSQNKIFAANNSNVIGIFDINTGANLGHYTVGNGSIAALAVSIDGSILYAAEYGLPGTLYAVRTSDGSIANHVSTSASHDIAVGPDGNVYATYFNSHQGVVQFSPILTLIGTFIPNSMLPYAGGVVLMAAAISGSPIQPLPDSRTEYMSSPAL